MGKKGREFGREYRRAHSKSYKNGTVPQIFRKASEPLLGSADAWKKVAVFFRAGS
jgi:hypothetical protein